MTKRKDFKGKNTKSFSQNLQHSFFSIAFVLLIIAASFSLGLIYWLLYNIRL